MTFSLIAVSVWIYGQADSTALDSLVAVAETSDEVDPIDPTQLTNYYEMILTAILSIATFLGRGIPAFQRVPQYVYVFLALGIVLGTTYVSLGFGTPLSAVWAVIASSGIYGLIKPFLRNIPWLAWLFGGQAEKTRTPK